MIRSEPVQTYSRRDHYFPLMWYYYNHYITSSTGELHCIKRHGNGLDIRLHEGRKPDTPVLFSSAWKDESEPQEILRSVAITEVKTGLTIVLKPYSRQDSLRMRTFEYGGKTYIWRWKHMEGSKEQKYILYHAEDKHTPWEQVNLLAVSGLNNKGFTLEIFKTGQDLPPLVILITYYIMAELKQIAELQSYDPGHESAEYDGH